MNEPILELLQTLCSRHPTRAKWVFVPSHVHGRVLGERLALGGINWLNLRFVTPLDVALQMGAPFLVERDIDPSEEGLGPALAMRLMAELPEGSYFAHLANQPTMAQALWATLRELRMLAGRPTLGPLSPKLTDLSAVLAGYGRFVRDNKRADMADVYAEALHHLDWCPIKAPDCWTELPGVVWTPLQRLLIDAMPGERIRPKALDLPGIEVPRRLKDACVDRVAPNVARHPLAFVMSPQAAGGVNLSSRLHLFHAGGREAEIEEVFRRILTAGAPLDQVEIACASDAHLALVWEKALRHEWPVTSAPGIPATFTRPGPALLGLCDWVETDFSAGHLRRLLQSGDMRVGRRRGVHGRPGGAPARPRGRPGGDAPPTRSPSAGSARDYDIAREDAAIVGRRAGRRA